MNRALVAFCTWWAILLLFTLVSDCSWAYLDFHTEKINKSLIRPFSWIDWCYCQPFKWETCSWADRAGDAKCSAKSGTLKQKNWKKVLKLKTCCLQVGWQSKKWLLFVDEFGMFDSDQMGAVETSFEEVNNIFDTGGSKGLPGDSVEKIPKIKITSNNNVDDSGERVSCSVCLQVHSYSQQENIVACIWVYKLEIYLIIYWIPWKLSGFSARRDGPKFAALSPYVSPALHR